MRRRFNGFAGFPESWSSSRNVLSLVISASLRWPRSDVNSSRHFSIAPSARLRCAGPPRRFPQCDISIGERHATGAPLAKPLVLGDDRFRLRDIPRLMSQRHGIVDGLPQQRPKLVRQRPPLLGGNRRCGCPGHAGDVHDFANRAKPGFQTITPTGRERLPRRWPLRPSPCVRHCCTNSGAIQRVSPSRYPRCRESLPAPNSRMDTCARSRSST
jgi:hypothetical protein